MTGLKMPGIPVFPGTPPPAVTGSAEWKGNFRCSVLRSGSADLSASFFKVLDGMALVLKKYDKTIVEVAGHTDNAGKEDYNQALSDRRAGTVAQYLAGKGIRQERTITVGGGENHPVTGNDTESGRALNRRVELTLLPLKQ